MKKLKQDIYKEKGITLIALVVTIVVLLILAAVSINMLTGENGIIRQAQKAKEETEKGEEKEQVSLAVTAAMGKDEWGNIKKADLQEELDNLTGGKATVSGDGPFTVEFESGRSYIVDINGKGI